MKNLQEKIPNILKVQWFCKKVPNWNCYVNEFCRISRRSHRASFVVLPTPVENKNDFVNKKTNKKIVLTTSEPKERSNTAAIMLKIKHAMKSFSQRFREILWFDRWWTIPMSHVTTNNRVMQGSSLSIITQRKNNQNVAESNLNTHPVNKDKMNILLRIILCGLNTEYSTYALFYLTKINRYVCNG